MDRGGWIEACTGVLMGLAVMIGSAAAGEPDHPIITEVYNNPPGNNDGPIGRETTNEHQEFIEIYLPPASALNTSLMPFKDALRLTFYEVEGDSSSSGNALVNYRFDLPTFDLDSSNGLTGIERPLSGVVVLGWVDYTDNDAGTCAGNALSCSVFGQDCTDLSLCEADPPTALAGTSANRVGLVNGEITSDPTDYVFIGINAHHFGGTTGFPPELTAESLIDIACGPGGSCEARSGIIQNGSAAYLLVNRDDPGYAELCDDKHAGDCALGADPQLRHPSPGLPDGNILAPSAFLDGFAPNDDSLFRVDEQPYDAPTGDDIDLETVLPLDGAFSLLIPQIPEQIKTNPNPGFASGYARVYIDVAKTTENTTPDDDDPVADATLAYRHVRDDGPFFPSPGKAAKTRSDPELGVALDSEQTTEVLTQTVGFPGLLCANVGGDFGIDIAVISVGPSSDENVATFALGSADTNVGGQTFGFPGLVVTPGAGATHGATATATVSVQATNTLPPPDLAVDTTPQPRTVTVTILDPKTGLNSVGADFQATVFAASQAVPNTAAANELLSTDLGAFLTANLGGLAQETMGNGAVLIDPTFDLTDGQCIHAGCNCDIFGLNCNPPQLITDYPDPELPAEFLNMPGPDGVLRTSDDLLDTVLNSAEQLVHGTYDENIFITDVGTCVGSGLLCSILAQDCADFTTCLPTNDGLRALRFNTPNTRTFGGTFSLSELVHFADDAGRIDNPRSGLANAITTRTFELVIVDTNVRQASTPAIPNIETGATDDFGIIIEVFETETSPPSPVSLGEFVFLSFSGGLHGSDIDGLNVPPDNNVLNLIYLDLDNLHDELGIISIDQVILIDGGGNVGQADIIEIFSLNPVSGPACGNGILEVGEDCDDGDTIDGDGCDSNCTVTACGNGIVTGAEQCDDGNTVDGDGCDVNCVIEFCGDGTVNNSGTEQCDDGNAIDGDGCDANCVIEFCGDGTVNNSGTEQCDDGNTIDGDGCDANCVIEFCGDGTVNNSGTEQCDDGNTIDGDGCSSACIVEIPPSCGDGATDPGEECDDGNTIDGDGCDRNCTITACGNLIITAGEQCDDGNTAAGDGCDENCQIEAAACLPPTVTAGISSRYIRIDPDPSIAVPVAFHIACSGVVGWVTLAHVDYIDLSVCAAGTPNEGQACDPATPGPCGFGTDSTQCSVLSVVNIGTTTPNCGNADFLTPDQWTSNGANALYATGPAVAPNSIPTVTAVCGGCGGSQAAPVQPADPTWVFCDSSNDGQTTFFADLFKQFQNTAAAGGAKFTGPDPGIEVDTQGDTPAVPDQQVTFFADIFACFGATAAGGSAPWTGTVCP